MKYLLIAIVLVLFVVIIMFMSKSASPVIYTEAVCDELNGGYICKDKLFLRYDGVSTEIPEIQSKAVFFKENPKTS